MGWFSGKVANDNEGAQLKETDLLLKTVNSLVSTLDARLKHIMTFNDNLPTNPDSDQEEQLHYMVREFNQRIKKVSSSLHAAVHIKQEAQAQVWELKVFKHLGYCGLKEGKALDISIEETHVQLQTILKNLKDSTTRGILIASVKGAKQKDPVKHHIYSANKNSGNNNNNNNNNSNRKVA